MNLSKRTRKIIGYSLLSIFGIIIVVLIWNSFAYYSINPFLPPSGETAHQMELTYPAASQSQGILIYAFFAVVANKPLSEGVYMNITDPHLTLFTGTDSNKRESHNIASVEIGFQHAQPSPILMGMGISNTSQNYEYLTLSGAKFWLVGDLNDSEDVQFPFELYQNTPFYFPVAGDYSPSMVILLKNGSLIRYTDDEVKLHVPSTAELQTQAITYASDLAAIAFLVFSFIEAFKLVNDWTKN